MTNNYATGTFTGLIAFLVIGGGLLSSGQQAYADDSLTVSISGNPSVNISPSSEGTFADSGDITIGVSNAPAAGYTLAITGTSNTSLTGKTDSTKSIASISSAIDQSVFSSNADYNNKWGYKPSMYYNSSTETRTNNSNYLPVPGATADIIDITDDNTSNNYTLSIGARVTNTLGFQTYESNTFTIAAVPNVTTDYLQITYDANGGYFGSDTSKTTNLVSYDAVGETQTTKETIAKYSHTPNISDAGVQSGNYANSYTMNDVVTIDGAGRLHIKLTYGGESASYDWVSLWAGNYPSYTAANNYSSGVKCDGSNNKYGGGSGTTVECDIDGDTVTFAFKSDGSGVGNGYGYYAVVTGESVTETVITPYSKTAASGTYAVPNNADEDMTFLGWSEDPNAKKATYANESGVSTNLRSVNGDAEVTLYAVWRRGSCDADNICYDGNGATAGEMANQPASNNATVMLQAYNYKRDGYGFLGWSEEPDPTIGTDTIYGPMEDITTPSDLSTNGMILYAVWLPKSTTYNMQNFSSSTCSSQLTAITYNSSDAAFTVAPNSFIALEDTRDGNVYTVARLSDGNCWMLENLRLDDSATGINKNTLSQNGGSFTISQLPASTNSFSSTKNIIQWNKNNTDINNTDLTASYNTNDDFSKWYGYGNYYSWAAARGSNSTPSTSGTSETTTSICPANWRLPIGDTTSAGFCKLNTSMGGSDDIMGMSSSTSPTAAVMSARFRHFPNNFLYSGRWVDGTTPTGRSTGGFYWTSTNYFNNGTYSMFLTSSAIYPGINSVPPNYNGNSVRCVAGS